jgi:uncharacterized protein YkwD
MRMLGVTALAAAALSVAPAPTLAAGVGDCVQDDAWPAARQDYADQVVALVNAHRATLGLAPLTISPTLTAAAVWKVRHMAFYKYFTHDDPAPPVARTWRERLQACGYAGDGMGENIALGYETPEAVVEGWIRSPEHAANIENPAFRAIGVGVARAATLDGYLFWDQEFGTLDDSLPPADTSPPSAPGQLAATASSPTQVALTWAASTDNVGVTGYRVYREGVEVAATPLLGYTDNAVSAGTTYSYTVRAFDGAGLLGPASDAAAVVTPPAPPVATIFASTYAIEAGLGASFGLGTGALRAQDGVTVDIASVAGTVGWYGRFIVPRGLSSLGVSYAGTSTQPCTRTISLYDWVARTWEALETGAGSAAVTAAARGPFDRFLGGSSLQGAVRARVTCSRPDGLPFLLQTDRLTLTAG